MIKKEAIKAVKSVKNPVDTIKDEISHLRLPNRTLGQKAADWITQWAGSWTFIFGFFIFLLIWMIVNTTWLVFGKSWDSYPFILLNLILSCLAAIQAPVILMSQNRQSEKDRLKAQYDYAVNRKAEKEIRQIQAHLVKIEKMVEKKLKGK